MKNNNFTEESAKTTFYRLVHFGLPDVILNRVINIKSGDKEIEIFSIKYRSLKNE